MGDGVPLDGKGRSCADMGSGEDETEYELALAKLVVLDCGGVSSISGPVSSVGLGAETAARSSGWAVAYAASTVSIHLPSWRYIEMVVRMLSTSRINANQSPE